MTIAETDRIEDLPACGGAYLLVIDVERPIHLPDKGGLRVLAQGRHLYCGSANGPGGIRARVGRHNKAAKTVRWHVDRLTNVFGVWGVLAIPGARECDLVAGLIDTWGGLAPFPGFGSSDCRVCPSHLIQQGQIGDEAGFAALCRSLAPGGGVSWRRPPAACFWQPGTAPRRPG